MIQVYNNFLPKKVFKTLKDAMMGYYFPWYFNDYVNEKNEKSNHFQFTFQFLKNGKYECWGEWKDIMVSVLQHIKHKKVKRVKANLLTRTDKITEHLYHIDQKKRHHRYSIFK